MRTVLHSVGQNAHHIAVVVKQLAHVNFLLFLRKDSDIERQRAKLQQHLKRFRNARFGNIFTLDDRLISLHTTHHVVRLNRKNLLKRMRRAVGLQRPNLHFAETLAAELRLSAQGLLRNQ